MEPKRSALNAAEATLAEKQFALGRSREQLALVVAKVSARRCCLGYLCLIGAFSAYIYAYAYAFDSCTLSAAQRTHLAYARIHVQVEELQSQHSKAVAEKTALALEAQELAEKLARAEALLQVGPQLEVMLTL